MYDYFLFDLDGTLIDSGEGVTNAVAYALDKMGIEVPDRTELYKFIGPPLSDSFHDFYGMDPQTCQKAIDFYREYYPVKGVFECFLYDGVRETLAALKAQGKVVLMATSKPEEQAVRILKHFEIDGLFDVMAGASLDSSRSRKEAVVAYALEKGGVKDLSKAIMVGDRHFDVNGARENGMDCIGVLYGYGTREEMEEAGAKFIVEKPQDILAFA